MMTNFHVIRSVKGGSGKTTFALHKVVDLANEKEKNKPHKKILYIDADVHASETRNMLLQRAKGIEANTLQKAGIGNITEAFYFEFYKDQYSNADLETGERADTTHDMQLCCKHTLNSYMHPYKGYYSSLSELALKGKLVRINNQIQLAPIDSTAPAEDNMQIGELNIKETDNAVDFVFSDPCPMGRKVFESQYQSSGKSAVGVGAYIAKMKGLFQYIVDEEYNDVVLDMPPGSDTFSEHLMDSLIGFAKESGSKCSLNIYYISTRDFAHIRTAANAAVEHLHIMRQIPANCVFFVDNLGITATSSSRKAYSSRKEIKEHILRTFRGTEEMCVSSSCISSCKGGLSNTKTGYQLEAKNRTRIFELDRLEYCTLMHDSIYYLSNNEEGIGLLFSKMENGPIRLISE